MQGVHDKNMVDKAYREDEALKATAPKTRGSEMLHEGKKYFNKNVKILHMQCQIKLLSENKH